MADSSEPAFLFLYRKEAVAPVDYLSTFATAPLFSATCVLNFLVLLYYTNPANMSSNLKWLKYTAF